MFTDGDIPIVWLLFEYHFLQTGQLARLLERSRQVVLRRLRELVRLDFVKPLSTGVAEENCYALGPMGWRLIAHELNTTVDKLPFSKRGSRALSFFWKHTLLTNDIRIALAKSAEHHPHVAIHRYIPEWQQIEQPKRRAKRDKHLNYVLWQQLQDEKTKAVHDHRPDGLFLVGRRNDSTDARAALFIEADRGTESISHKINAKFTAYRLYYDQKLYFQQFDAGVMRVLFCLSNVKTDRRITAMQHCLQTIAKQLGDPDPKTDGTSPASFVHAFRFTRMDRLSDTSSWDYPVFEDWKGEKHALFKSPEKQNDPESGSVGR